MGQRLKESTINQIPVRNYAYYLQANGWEEVDTDATGSYWNKVGSDPGVYSWLPSNPDVRTFSLRISQLVEEVAKVEGRDVNEVLRDLTDLQRDVQEVRTFPGGKSGSITLGQSSESIQGLHKWVESAAVAVGMDEAAVILPRRKPPAALALLRSTELLTPIPGSFIWRLSLPLGDHELENQFPFDIDGRFEDYARRTTRRLYASTRVTAEAASESLSQDTGVEPFRARITEGITADLCDALSQISVSGATPLEFNFRWSRYRPVPDANEQLALSTEQLEVIGWAGKELRREALEPDVTVKGFVVRLTRTGPNIMPGKITISGSETHDPQGQVAHYWVELSAEDYQKAQDAHSKYEEVTVTGDLRRSTRRRELLNPSQFHVLNGPGTHLAE
ncbi:hypothetical protein [Arthrobacter sp. zg-Y844]|uniref:hypothetical protein n=1 Tax=Arthrobacter sp. zg-Y844 TaxID=2964612 RepID=UPI0021021521|nr:hypothetical protein [Arthrobacter sp. zg-Y844]MCQ1988048.1 hypothetical protein [Arthrobacter sp. zg-Y844]